MSITCLFGGGDQQNNTAGTNPIPWPSGGGTVSNVPVVTSGSNSSITVVGDITVDFDSTPGSEFIATFSGAMAERLRAGIESLPMGITVSCGVASLTPADPDAWNALIDRADRALYAAKAAGRNCVRADDDWNAGVLAG